MALPKLNNDTPRYELTIPSTKEKVKYRPFLVKEQKNILVALESQDAKQILGSVMACIESCIPDCDSKKLATFDVDYMFTQVRSKSVGEKSNINAVCVKCEEDNQIEIDLSQINLNDVEIKDTIIKLNDEISVKMKYPTYNDMMNNPELFKEGIGSTDVMFETIYLCIDSIMTEEEHILIKDEPREEVEVFINSLTTAQLEKIIEFIQAMPTIEHSHEYTCQACGEKSTQVFSGIQDFF